MRMWSKWKFCHTPYALHPITSAIFSEAGDDVLLSVVYSCDSNEESSLEVSLHLLEEKYLETMWPSGFNDMSVTLVSGESMGSVNCDFGLTTPSIFRASGRVV